MKVMILGGTGTISEPITRKLVERGDEVYVYNRGRRSDAPAGARVVTGDRHDTAGFRAAMHAHAPYDCVIDMICFTPEDATTDVNVFAGKTRQLIFCSTVDVHRKDCLTGYLALPASERTEFTPWPSFTYAVNKVKCEQIFHAAHDRGDFTVTVIRPGLTYREGGAPLHPFRGGTWHLDRLLKGKPVILHGDGTSLWTACHSDDVSTAFVNAIGNDAALGNGYIVAAERWMSWQYYWRVAADALGAPSPTFVHIPADVLERLAPTLSSWIPPHFQFHAIFDVSAAKRDLGFAPTISWEAGCRRCIDWLNARGAIESSDAHPEYDTLVGAWEASIESMEVRLAGIAGL
ncbi:MAG: NAD-dependent epimerase/dehydratase family protein [Spirochaetaceae bacterium]|nr:MAG: NAD-dependent epimerase/dehydratase family protein [Spirochaetaceae bacterium]